jgi:hypothetical protein
VTAERLRELARAGAEATLKELRAEIIALERTFPELALKRGRHALRRSVETVKKRSRTLSEEARKAISARMTKYWAERRKAKARMK